VCGQLGEIFMCDECPKVFHGECCDPPLELDQPWSCNECDAAKGPIGGPFGGLTDLMRNTNPSFFKMPEPIEKSFSFVHHNVDGDYRDMNDLSVVVYVILLVLTPWNLVTNNH
jgi:hypothetical protein